MTKTAAQAIADGTLTEDQIMDAAARGMEGLDNPGLCTECGHEAEGVEPDARGYECEVCGEHTVYGAEELMLSLPLSV